MEYGVVDMSWSADRLLAIFDAREMLALKGEKGNDATRWTNFFNSKNIPLQEPTIIVTHPFLVFVHSRLKPCVFEELPSWNYEAQGI